MVFSMLMVFIGKDCPKHEILLHCFAPHYISPCSSNPSFSPAHLSIYPQKNYLEIQKEKRAFRGELFDPGVFYTI